MFNRVLSIFTAFLFLAAAPSVAQISVGYMNVQEVMMQLPERDSVEQELNSFVAEREERFQQRATDFQSALAEYEENQSSMSEQEQAEREEELQNMEQELTTYQNNLRSEIEQHRQKLLAPLYEKIDVAIATVAEEMDLDFVLNEQTSQGEQMIYFSSDQRLNITDEVLEQIRN